MAKGTDLAGMSDAELAGLMDEMRQESTRRSNKLGNTNKAALLKSRWGAALLLLCIAFFILFKAETSGMDEEADKVLAKPGNNGAWLMEPDDRLDQVQQELKELKEKVDGHHEKVGEFDKDEGGDAKEGEVPTTADTTATEETKEEEKPAEPETSATPAQTTAVLGDFPFNKADDETKKAAHEAGTYPKVKYQYNRRSVETNQDILTKLAEKWSSWTLVDPKAGQRPKDDYAKDFPHRDITWDKFPANAWQTDQEYLSKYLPEATSLVERALEAMLGEYGWSKFDLPNQDFEARVNGGSFKAEVLNLSNETMNAGKSFKGDTLSGWYTPEYFQGLKRRLMHSLITEDTFTMVMGGHSAAAGHGNHFQQSYTLQFHKVLEPVMARLGVKLHTTNNGYGGLGTGQNAMAAGDLYGKEIDILVWDTQMTENSNEAYDAFVKQALVSGNRFPVLLGGMKAAMEKLYTDITPEVGMFGTGIAGVPEVTDAKQAESIIWAARYLRCPGEMHGHCREKEYDGTCWIDRDDYTPETKQKDVPGGRASWHPGYKQHAIKGRIIAFPVLRALLEGLKEWDAAPDKKLPVEKWHVADHYEGIRTKLNNMKEAKQGEEGGSFCYNYEKLEPKSFCNYPYQGVSEMTPRANPRETAIRNIMKPAYNGYVPVPMENAYNPPDVFNPSLHVPPGEFDYLAVVENGVEYPELLAFDNSPLPKGYLKTGNKLVPLGLPDIEPGLGWYANSNANPDECDGSFDGFCGRGVGNDCLLYGHNDHRGGLGYDSYSGWGVFTVPNVKLGVIIARLEWWHTGKENPLTQEWESENNGDEHYGRRLSVTNTTTTAQRSRRLGESVDNRRLGEALETGEQTVRMLKGQELCPTFSFEFAVNGKITKYSKEEFMEKLQVIQRVVQCQTFLNDPTVANGETVDVEIAMRITGCAHTNVMMLSNIYWA